MELLAGNTKRNIWKTMRLKDKVCIITGSSSGIGKEIAKGFYPGIMPSAKGSLTNEEVDAIVDYLKTLK